VVPLGQSASQWVRRYVEEVRRGWSLLTQDQKALWLSSRQPHEALKSQVDDAAYSLFRRELLRQPERGDVIFQGGGLRKARMRLPSRGKRGGARVIYLHLPKYDTIVLFYLYTKAQRGNLSLEQLRRPRAAAAIIKQEFRA
jgi:hypothetical protein